MTIKAREGVRKEEHSWIVAEVQTGVSIMVISVEALSKA